jgi:hypothetical protein
VLPKDRMEDTGEPDNQTTRNSRYSWVGLGHILPNRVFLATYVS